MAFHRISRRRFLEAAGATTAMAAGAATLTGFSDIFDLPSQTKAVSSLQTNLSNFVDLRFGMFER